MRIQVGRRSPAAGREGLMGSAPASINPRPTPPTASARKNRTIYVVGISLFL